jgi:hypothetical protein
VHRAALQQLSSAEPLRHLVGIIVGRIAAQGGRPEFVMDSLSTPGLGAEVFPLDATEAAAIFRTDHALSAPIHLGDDLRSGGRLMVGLSELITRHVAVLASSGQGKSCFTAAILQQVVQFPRSRIVIFDINGEYETAFDREKLPRNAVMVTRFGAEGQNGFRIPYYALGRQGLQRLLVPSERTQRPALTLAIESLNRVRWFPRDGGAGLLQDTRAVLFDDCRSAGADIAAERLQAIRAGQAPPVAEWPNMSALSALVAESYALAPRNNGWERNALQLRERLAPNQ